MTKPVRHSAWWLVTPALVVLLVVGVIPLLTVVNHSLHDIFTLPDTYWVGAEWYQEIVRSERFRDSLGRSLLFSLTVIAIEFPLGIALALALPRQGPWVSVSLVVIALPLLVPWNMIPGMWLSLVAEHGWITRFLHTVSIDLDWKFNPLHTWGLIVAMDVWHWTSLVIILCYASLTTLPSAYYQAAAIDAASRWQVFRYLQLPRMRSVLLMALMLRFMDSFMIYTEAFGINAGGPQNATLFLAMDLGEEIKAYNYGPAAARSVIYFLIVLSVAWTFKTLMFNTGRADER